VHWQPHRQSDFQAGCQLTFCDQYQHKIYIHQYNKYTKKKKINKKREAIHTGSPIAKVLPELEASLEWIHTYNPHTHTHMHPSPHPHPHPQLHPHPQPHPHQHQHQQLAALHPRKTSLTGHTHSHNHAYTHEPFTNPMLSQERERVRTREK